MTAATPVERPPPKTTATPRLIPPPPPPPPPSSQKNKPSSSSLPSNNSHTLQPPPTTTATTTSTSQPKNKTTPSSRFHFLQNNPITATTTSSSTKNNTLQKLEDDAIRRRSISRHRLQQLEHLLSLWNGQIITEALERESEYDNLLQTGIHDPLTDIMGRIMAIMEKRRQRRRIGDDDVTGGGDKETDDDEETRLDVLQQRLSNMEQLLLRWKCLDSDTITQKAFHAAESDIRGGLFTAVAREVISAADEENALTMTFDSMAATLSTDLREEMVERMTDVTFLKQEVGLSSSSTTTKEDGKQEEKEKRTENVDKTTMTTRDSQKSRFFKEIADIRSLLEKEREDRKISDERVLDQIIQTKEYLQKLVLEAIGGGSGVL